MKQSRASRLSSHSCIWGTGKPTGAVAMITANTNNLYGHQLDNIRKWREQFVQLPEFVLKHILAVLWTKPPDFRRLFVYFWHHVDWLRKLPSLKQKRDVLLFLSRNLLTLLLRLCECFEFCKNAVPRRLLWLSPWCRERNWLFKC